MSLHLLSLHEEAMTKKLIHSKGKAIIEHSVFIEHLLSSDECIGEHEFLWGVLDDLIISVDSS